MAGILLATITAGSASASSFSWSSQSDWQGGTLVGLDAVSSPGDLALHQVDSPALRFNGSTQYVTLPSGFSDFSKGLTIDAWINPAAVGNNARVVDLGNGSGPSDNIVFYRLGTSNDLAFIVAHGGSWGTTVVASNVLQLNTWTHVSVTEDAQGNVVIYKNGVQAGSGNTFVPTVVTRTSNFAGRSNWYWAEPTYQGLMDDLQISGSVRHSGSFVPPTTGIADASTYGLYHFDDTAGQSLADSSPLNHPAIQGANGLAASDDPTWDYRMGGNLLSFDGSSSLAQNTALSGLTSSGTLELSMRTGSAQSDGTRLAEAGNSTDRVGIEMDSAGHAVLDLRKADSQIASVVSSGTVSGGAWHHLAATWSSTGAYLYVDGALAGFAEGDKTLSLPASATLSLGSSIGGGSYYAGYLKNLRISNVVRYTTGFTSPASLVSDGSTVGAWKLQDGSGQALADSSAANQPLTLGTTSGSEASDPTWLTSVLYTSSGTANLTYDGGLSRTYSAVSWNATLPAGTQIHVRARTASSVGNLKSSLWSSVQSSSPATLVGLQPGRYLEVEATLVSSADSSVTPLLSDLTVDSDIQSGTPPAAPTNQSPVPGSIISATAPTLSAGPFSDSDGGNTHQASQWQLSAVSGNYASPLVDSGASSSHLTSYPLPVTLSQGTYYWHVHYQDSDGNWGPYSPETSFSLDTIPPQQVTGIHLEGADGQVAIQWVNPTASDYAGLKVYRSAAANVEGSLVHTTASATETSWTDTGVTNGVRYYYTLEPFDQAGNQGGPGVASDPSTRALWHLDDGQGLTYADSSSYGTNLAVQGSMSSVPGLYGGALSMNDNAYLNASLSPSLSGDFTVEGWFYPTTLGGASDMFHFMNGNGSQGLSIYRNGTSLVIDNATVADFNIGNVFSLNTWVNIAIVKSGLVTTVYSNGAVIATGTGPDTGALTSVQVGQFYNHCCIADWIGTMDELRVSSVARPVGQLEYFNVNAQNSALPSDAAVTLTSPNGGETWNGESTHTITWSASGSSVSTISLAYSLTSGTSWTTIATGLANTGTYTWGAPEIPYASTVMIRAQAVAADSTVLASDMSNDVLTLDTVAPPALAGLSAKTTGTSALLSWSLPTGADISSLVIHRSTSAGSQGATVATLNDPHVTSWLDTGLSSGTTYYYSITSVDRVGNLSPAMGLKGKYYSDTSGLHLVANRTDATLNASPWTSGSLPSEYAGQTSNFSATWDGSVRVDVGDPVIFSVAGQGSAVLFVDGSQVVNLASSGTATGSVTLSPGLHSLRLSYVAGGSAGTVLSWSTASGSIASAVIPADHLNGQLPVTPSDDIISLGSPNGGQLWRGGSVHPVTWSSSGVVTPATVSLYYSTDGGASYPNYIGSSVDATGSFDWTVPSLNTSSIKVRVEARGTAGDLLASDLSDLPITVDSLAPLPVTTFVATPSVSGQPQVQLTWTNPTDPDFVSLHVYRSLASGSLGTLISTVNAPGASLTDSTVSYGTTYFYTVKSVDAVGNESGFSANGLLGTYYPNLTRTGSVGTHLDPTINFNWGTGAPYPPSGMPADGFSIVWNGYLKIDTSGTYTFSCAADDTCALTVDGTAVSAPVVLTAGIHAIAVSYQEFGGGASVALSYSGPGVSSQIIPQDHLGTAGDNAQLSATPNDDSVTVTGPSPATYQGGSVQNITWTSAGTGIASVAAYYSVDGGSTWTTIATGLPDTATYAWTTPLRTDAATKVKVGLYNSQGSLIAFDVGQVLTLDSTSPGAVTDLSASTADQSVTLTWVNPAASDLVGSHIYRSTTTLTPGTLIGTVTAPGTSYTDTAGLTNGTPYYYRVRPYDAVGNEGAGMAPSAVMGLGFDEGSGQTSYDSSGNGNNAVLGADAGAAADDPTWVAGDTSGALQTSGSQYSRVASSGSLTYGSTFTVATRFKTSSAGWAWLVTRPNGSWLGIDPGGYIDWTAQGGLDYHSTKQVNDNLWHCAVVTYSSGSLNLYVDGSPYGSWTGVPNNYVTGSVTLGQRGDGTEYFHGLMDSASIYNDVQAGSDCSVDSSSSVTATPAANASPGTPTLVAPANAARQTSHNVTLQVSGYTDPQGDVQAASQWQVSTTANFGNPVIDTGDDATDLLSYTTASLPEGDYYWRMRVKDASGTYSNYTPTRSFAVDITAPRAPYAFSVTPSTQGAGQVALSWSNPTDSDLAGTNIYRSTASGTQGTLIHTVPAPGTSWTDPAVTLGTTYFYSLTSFDTLNQESPAATIGGPYVPDIHTKLLWHLDEASGTPVDLSGSFLQSSIVGTSPITGGLYGNGRTVGSGLNYLSSTTAAGWYGAGTVEYWIKPSVDLRKGTYGLISNSNDCWNLTAYTGGDGKLYVGANCSGFTGYAIPSDWTNTWVHLAISWDGSHTYLYVNGSLVLTTTQGYGNTYYFDTAEYIGLNSHQGWTVPAVIDEVRISDINRAGIPFSNQTSATAVDRLPDNPLGVRAVSASNQVVLSWSANPVAADFDHINIYRSTAQGSLGSLIHSTSGAENTAKSWTDAGVSSGTTYYYQLRGVDTAGNEGIVGMGSDSVSTVAYSFDEMQGTASADQTGHANAATLVGSPSWVLGNNEGALSFNGTSSYVSVPPSGKLGQTQFTMDFWVKTHERRSFDGTYWPTLVGEGSAFGSSGDFGVTVNNGYIGINSGLSANGDNSARSGIRIDDDQWHYVVVINTGSEADLYVDGVEAARLATGLGLDAGSFYLGAVNLLGSPAYYSASTIDGFRFAPVARSYADLQPFGSHQVAATVTPAAVTLTSPTGPATYKGGATASLAWSSSDPSVDSVSLYYSTDGGVSFPNLIATGQAPSAAQGWTVPSINSSTVKVRAVAEDSIGNVLTWSDSSASFAVDSAAPADPSAVTAVATSGQVALSWTNPLDSDFDSVAIYRSTTVGQRGSLIHTVAAPGTSYTDTTVADGTEYYYVLSSVDTSGNEAVGARSVSDSSTLGLWNFSEGTGTSVADGSGNGHTGTVIGGATWGTGSDGSRDLVMTGAGQYVQVGNMGSLPTSGTIEFSLKTGAALSDYPNVLTTNNGGYNNAFRFEEHADGLLQVDIGNPSGNSFIGLAYTTNLQRNTWYDVYFSWDTVAGTVKGYLNGTKVFDQAQGFWPGGMPNFAIGNGYDARYWIGQVDNVRVSSVVRPVSLTSQYAAVPNDATVSLTSPSGGESWNAESAQTISWTSTGVGVGSVNLEYSLDAESSWVPITTGQPASGSYAWTVPSAIDHASALVRARAMAGDISTVMAASVSPALTLDGQPPLPITGLRTNATASAITLNWTNPGSADFDHVEIYRSTSLGAKGSQIESNLSPNSSIYQDAAVSPGTKYYYTVQAVDKLGNHSRNGSVLDGSTVASWNFNQETGQTLADASATANPATLGASSASASDDPTWTTAGRNQGALTFNGSNQYVSAPDSSAYTLSGDFTIETWAKFSTVGNTIFMGQDEGGGYRNKWLLIYESGILGFRFADYSTETKTVSYPWTPSVGTWYHLAVVRSGSLFSLYINGDLVASAVNAGTIPDVTAPLTIGEAEGLYYMNGQMDGATVSQVARTPSSFNYGDQRVASVTDSAITVTAPNGGEKLGNGAVYPITWNKAGTAVDHYGAYYSTDGGVSYPSIIATGISGSATSQNWTLPLINSESVRVRVVGYSADGQVLASDVSDANVTLDSTPPSPVRNPRATLSTSGPAQIQLDWGNPPESDFAQIKIYRSTTSSSLGTRIATLGTSDTTYTDTDVSYGGTYYYAIKAVDEAGNESPGVQAGMLATYYSSTTFTGPVASVVEPVINLAGNGGPSLPLGVPRTAWSARWDGWLKTDVTEDVTFYVAANDQGAVYLDGSSTPLISLTGSGSATTRLSAGFHRLRYDFIQYNDVYSTGLTYSSASISRQAIPADHLFWGDVLTGHSIVAVLTDAAVSVTGPVAGDHFGGASVRHITWSDSGTGIASAGISYSTDGGTSWSTLATAVADTGSYDWMVPIVDSTTALVRVGLNDSQGNVVAVSLSDPFVLDSTPPAAPTNITATGSTNGASQVTLAWTNPTDADFDGVTIYRSTTKGSLGSAITSQAAGVTSYVDTTTADGTTYYYAVGSRDVAGNTAGAYSLGGPYQTDASTKLLWHSEGPADSSGNGYRLTTYNGSQRAGKYGKGYYGNGDTVIYYDPTQGAYPSGQLSQGTVEFWYKAGQDPRNGVYGLFGSLEAYTCAGLSVFTDGTGNLKVGNRCGTAGSYALNADWTGIWHHLAVSWNGAATNLYVDGNLAGSYTLVSGGFSFGGNGPHLSDDYQTNGGLGTYDELRISTVARSSFLQVQTQYAASSTDAAPGQVADLAATPNDNEVDLSWTALNEPDIVGYNIYRSGAQGTLGSKVNLSGVVAGTTYADSTVTNGTRYYYAVRAVDAAGHESVGSTRTWTSQADWNTWNQQYVTATANPGDLRLSGVLDTSGLAGAATASFSGVVDAGSIGAINDGSVFSAVSSSFVSAATPYVLTWGSSQTVSKVRFNYVNQGADGPASRITIGYWNGSAWVTPSEWTDQPTGWNSLNSGGWTPYYYLSVPVSTTKIEVFPTGGVLCPSCMDLSEVDVPTGSAYVSDGTATASFTPQPGVVQSWSSATLSDSLPATTSAGVQYSNDNSSWYSVITDVPASETLYARISLSTSSVSLSPAVQDLSVTGYSQLSIVPSRPDIPATPTPVAPADGLRMRTAPTLSVSGYSDAEGFLQSATQWVVSAASNFSSPVVDTGADTSNLSSYAIPGTLADGTYYWHARFQDVPGEYSQYSVTRTFIIDTTAPALATGLTASPGSAAVALSWTNPADSDYGHLNIYRSTSAGVTQIPGNKVGQSSSNIATSFTESSLSNGTTYYYAVSSVDSLGNESGLSPEVSAQPAALSATVTAPTGGEHWGGGSSRNITWMTTGYNISSVSLYYSSNGGSSYPNTVATGLFNTGTYSWTVPSVTSATARVKVELRDGQGNVLGSGTSPANFTIDSVLPTYSAISVASNNSHTNLAKVGDTVTASFTASETLSGNPTVSLGGRSMTFSSLVGSVYTYTRVLTGSETEGSATLSISGTDLAGNVGSTATVTFTTDFTAPSQPTVSQPSAPLTVHAGAYLVQGTAAANSLVQVYRGASFIASQQLSGGATSYSISSTLTADAVNSFSVYATDLAGNQSLAASAPSITEDSTAPSAPAITSPASPVTVSVPTYSITGTAEANAAIRIYKGASVVGTQQLSGGATSFSISVSLVANSANTFRATALDSVGNESAFANVPTITNDVVPPSVPVITSPAAPVSTSASSYAVQGTANANALIHIYKGATLVGTQQLSGGATSFSVSVSLSSNAANDFTAASADAGGNESAAATVPTITNDTVAPVISSVSASSGNAHTDTSKAGDVVTASFAVSEALGANPTVTLGGRPMTFGSLVSGTYLYTRTIDGTESQGASALAISGADLAGNSVSNSASTFGVDTVRPAAPVITNPSGPRSVNTATYTVSGTAEANAFIRIYSGSSTVASLQLSGGATIFNVVVALASNTVNTFTATATDYSGNESLSASISLITQDSVAPGNPTVTLPAAPVRTSSMSRNVSGTAEPNSLVKVYRGVFSVASQQLAGGATAYDISVPLSINAANSLSVTASDAAGNESSAVTVPVITQDLTAPTAPSGVTLTPSATGAAQVLLSWNNPGDTDLASISIYRSTTNGQLGSLLTSVAAPGTTYTDTTVSYGSSYYYTLKSVDTLGNETGTFLANGLVGSYFADTSYASQIGTNVDPGIDFSWAAAAPPLPVGMPSSNYSVRWQGFLKVDATENITFYSTNNNDAVLSIDGSQLLSSACCSETSTVISLTAGIHRIQYQFRNTNANAQAHLSYSSATITKQVIPQPKLSTTYSAAPQYSLLVSDAAVSLSSPVGGERWAGASSHAVTWIATGTGAATVKLRYSTDGGNTYPNLIAAGLALSDSYPWTIPPINTLAARVRAEVYDGSGNLLSTIQSGTNFTIDSVVPVFSGLSVGSNNAHSSTSKVGNAVTATFTASETLAANPTVSFGGKVMAFGSFSAGTYVYSRTLDGTETEGAATVQVNGSDLAGNAGSATSASFSTDFTVPASPAVTLPSAPLTVNAATYLVSGTAEANSLVTVYKNGSLVASQQLSGNATAYGVSVPLANGANQFSVTATDYAGNQSSAASVPLITQDASLPASPVVSQPAAPTYTNATSYAVTGTAFAGALVTLYSDPNGDGSQADGTLLGSQQLGWGATSFSISVTLASNQANHLVVTAKNLAATESPATVVPALTQDSVVPGIPSGVSASAGSGVVNLAWTNPGDSDLSFTNVYRSTSAGFTAGPGNRIGQSSGPAATVFSDGSALNGTTYYYQVTAVDRAGNESAVSTEVSAMPDAVTLDLTSPVGGEVWAGASSQPVTWTATGSTIASLGLAYSTDGGSSYSHSIATGLSNTGTYAWTVPSLNTPTVRVRVQALDALGNVMAVSSSAANFSIDSGVPAFALISALSSNAQPTVGRVGDVVTVRFSVSDGLIANPTVTLGGKAMVFASQSGNAYTYTRSLDGFETEGAAVLAISGTSSAGTAGSFSSATFATDFTAPAAPSVAAPASPVRVHASSYTVSGTAAAGSLVRAYRLGSVVASQQLPSYATAYGLTVPLLPDADNSFSLTAADAAGNESLPAFAQTITEDSTAPAGPSGIVLSAASGQVSISWTNPSDSSLAAVNIYRAGFAGFTPDSSNRIARVSGTAYVDTSVSNGTIYYYQLVEEDVAGNRSAPVAASAILPSDIHISVTSPVGGEAWTVGSLHSVTWSTSGAGIGSITLSYSSDGGISYGGTIAVGQSNSGSYPWKVAGQALATYRVKAEARDILGNVVASGTSGANFAVLAAPAPTPAPTLAAVASPSPASSPASSPTADTSSPIPSATLAASPEPGTPSPSGEVSSPGVTSGIQVSVTADSKAIILTISPVSEGYQVEVYRSTSPDQQGEFVGYASGRTFRDTAAAADTTYYYTVRAVPDPGSQLDTLSASARGFRHPSLLHPGENVSIVNPPVKAAEATQASSNAVAAVTVTVAAAGAAVSASASALAFADNGLVLRSLLAWIFGPRRRRRRRWGDLIDAETELPVVGATVFLLTQNGQEIARTVTDRSGGFWFFLEKGGEYALRFQKNEEYHSGRLYRLTIDDPDQLPPLMRVLFAPKGPRRPVPGMHLLGRVSAFVSLLRIPMLIVGSLLAVASLLFYRDAISLVVVVVYAGFWAAEVVSLRQARSFGLVRDKQDSHPLFNALVTLYRQSEDGLGLEAVKAVFTDQKGRYRAIVPPGEYVSHAVHDGYLFARTGPFSASAGKPLDQEITLLPESVVS